ncbi:MAG: hypothetical protein QM692_01380 [Thermomicrobiales bacterium]
MAQRPVGLVIDDLHLIENEAVEQQIERLFRELPPNAALFVLSRQRPQMSLARLRAYGRIRELTQNDLRFTPNEVEQVFAHHQLDTGLLAQFTDRTEGWIAGLQLLLMSIDHQRGDPSAQLERLLQSTEMPKLLSDYILEEVLNALPDDLHRFVLDTSVLSPCSPHSAIPSCRSRTARRCWSGSTRRSSRLPSGARSRRSSITASLRNARNGCARSCRWRSMRTSFACAPWHGIGNGTSSQWRRNMRWKRVPGMKPPR